MSSNLEHEHGHHYDLGKSEGRFYWFFHEFWQIAILATCFLIMCALPLTLSGALHNPFSASDSVWGGYGLLLIAEFLVAVVLVCLLPHLLGVYMLLLSIYGLVAAENGHAWTIGFISDGQHTWMINSIAILFLTYVAIGNLVFLNALRNERKSRL